MEDRAAELIADGLDLAERLEESVAAAEGTNSVLAQAVIRLHKYLLEGIYTIVFSLQTERR